MTIWCDICGGRFNDINNKTGGEDRSHERRICDDGQCDVCFSVFWTTTTGVVDAHLERSPRYLMITTHHHTIIINDCCWPYILSEMAQTKNLRFSGRVASIELSNPNSEHSSTSPRLNWHELYNCNCMKLETYILISAMLQWEWDLIVIGGGLSNLCLNVYIFANWRVWIGKFDVEILDQWCALMEALLNINWNFKQFNDRDRRIRSRWGIR